MHRLAAVALASALTFSSAFAAATDNAAPLTPGKAAGVKEAELHGSGLLWLGALVIVGGGLALVVSQGSGNKISTTTTGTSP